MQRGIPPVFLLGRDKKACFTGGSGGGESRPETPKGKGRGAPGEDQGSTGDGIGHAPVQGSVQAVGGSGAGKSCPMR